MTRHTGDSPQFHRGTNSSCSIYQIATQYVICSLTNDPERLARYAGVFRGVTAFGMMFSFIIDGNGGSYVAQLSFQFSCYFVGIVFLYVVAIWFITDSNYFHEDMVIVPRQIEEEAKMKFIVGEEVLAEEEGKKRRVSVAKSEGAKRSE